MHTDALNNNKAGSRADREDGKGNIMKGLVALVNLFPSCNTKQSTNAKQLIEIGISVIISNS